MKGLARIIQYEGQRLVDRPEADVTFSGWRHGLNTASPDHQIALTELAACVNFKPAKERGRWRPREGISQRTSTAINGVKAHKFVPISGTVYELSVDGDKKLYYNNSGTPTRIGGSRLLSSTSVYIFPYKSVALICDGSYLKYCDGTGATGVKIAYDDGTGTTGHQYNNISGTQDSTFALGNGTNTRIAQKITSQAWDSGYTIPPTTIKCYLSKTGSPTGSIDAKLRLVADDSVLATVEAYADVTELTGTAELVTVAFQSGTVTTEMSPSTAYYLTLEHSGGDGSNYVDVHYTDVASGGLAYYYDGSWNADATANLVISMRPGRPPKASFGEVYGLKPWIVNPDELGGAYVGNLTYLDWSTTAGFVGVADDDANSFPVGAVKTIYKQLYFFGTYDQPYIATLSGTSFSDYAIEPIYQRQWTTQNLIADTVNDLWFASSSGADSIAGVQEYGDLRTKNYSDPVRDRFIDYFDYTTDIAGYYPKDGQYLVQMMDYHRLLVFNISAQTIVGDDIAERRVPASEYEFCNGFLSDSTIFSYEDSGSGTNERYFLDQDGNDPSFTGEPDFLIMDGIQMTQGTAGSLNDHEWDYGDNDSLGFSTIYYRDDSGDISATSINLRAVMIPQTITEYGGELHLGFSDGYFYKLDTDEYKDLGLHQLFFDLRTKYASGKFSSVNLTKQQIDFNGEYGGRFDLQIYTNGQHKTPTATYTYYTPLDDRLRLVDMTMDLVDAWFLMIPTEYPLWNDMEVNANMFQARVTNMYLSGGPLYANSISFKMRKLES